MPRLRYVNSPAAQVSTTFNHGVTDGTYAFLSGQLAADATAPGVERSTIEGETRACLEQLAGVLREIGLGFEDVVRVNVYMTDLGQFDRMDRVYGTFFKPGHAPARTTVGVARLLLGCNIEIDCIARLRPR